MIPPFDIKLHIYIYKLENYFTFTVYININTFYKKLIFLNNNSFFVKDLGKGRNRSWEGSA